MLATIVLWCVTAFLALAIVAVTVARHASATPVVYGASLAASLVALAGGLAGLIDTAEPPAAAILPLGLPWLAAHFPIDALAAFFLGALNLGGRAASLVALRYGRH